MPGMAGMKAIFYVPLTKALKNAAVAKGKNLTIKVLPQTVQGRKPPAPSSTLESATVTVW
jgi:hypothetical protein